MNDLQGTPTSYSGKVNLPAISGQEEFMIMIKKEKNVRIALFSKVGIMKIYRLDLQKTRKLSLQNDDSVIIWQTS